MSQTLFYSGDYSPWFSIIIIIIIITIVIITIIIIIYLFIFCQITVPALECYQCSDIPGFPPNSTTCRSGKLGKTTCKGILGPKCYTAKLKKFGVSVVVRDCAIGDVCAPEFQDSRKYTTSGTYEPGRGGRGGTPHMKGVGMFVGNFELNP